MRFPLAAILVLICLVSIKQPAATILYVPSAVPSIQAAIDIAQHGDSVVVSPGVYFEHLNFRGKAITVASEILIDNDTSHIAATIIDGSAPGSGDTGSVVIFCNGETASSQLRGFTLREGDGTPVNSWQWGSFKGGGGVLVTRGTPTVSQCRFDSNSDDVMVIASNGSATLNLHDCLVEGTVTAMEGGVVSSVDCMIGWVNCLLEGNTIIRATRLTHGLDMEQGYGSLVASTVDGQLYCYRSSIGVDSSTLGRALLYMDGAITLTNCLVTGSITGEGENGGLWLERSTVLGNIAWLVKGVGIFDITRSVILGEVAYSVSTGRANCSIFHSWPTEGSQARTLDTANLYLETVSFCNSSTGNFRVSDASRCAPANNACGELIGAFAIGCSCCNGDRGNINASGNTDLSDLALLIAYLSITPVPSLPCISAANIDGVGIVDLSDLAALVSYLIDSGPRYLPRCPAITS